MATINAHVRSDLNRNLLYGVIQDLNIDIIGITETWFENGTSNVEMNKIFGKEFKWFGRERKIQKNYCGSGGIGILVRNSIGNLGNLSLVKISKQFEILWIKLDLDKIKYYIGAIYIPPDGSMFVGDVKQLLVELESDILEFRKDGKIILMGDFNARILDYPSTLNINDEPISFIRSTKDLECKDLESKSRGIQLVHTMNAANMMIMNGMDNLSEYTFTNSKMNTSIIDYIILSDNIIFPDNKNNLISNGGLVNNKSDNKFDSFSIPENSEYVHNSMKVYTDHKYIIGDHFLVSCKIKIIKTQSSSNLLPLLPKQSDSNDIHTLDIIKWNRRDHGDSDFWIPMQKQLEIELNKWENNFTHDSADVVVSEFNTNVNTALSLSLKIRKNSGTKIKNLSWNHEIFRCKIEEKIAYDNYKLAPDSDKDKYLLLLQNAKKSLKLITRKVNRNKMKSLVHDIENLKSKDSKEYWRKLYELDNSEPADDSIPSLVKNSSGILVDGKDANEAWRESFRKLGLEKTDFDSFDPNFYSTIKCTVESYSNSFSPIDNIIPLLDNPITLNEVEVVVKNLKRGKAVGVDGIFNEVFKYGGSQATKSLWKLYDYIFQNEDFPTDWSRGIIFPLFKGGPNEYRYDPNKYRGITLLSIVGKTYTAILNNRISNYLENNGILVDEQAGFRKNRSTTDQLFILTEIILNRRPKPTYAAFIDITKAYDRVWRDGLWYKLYKAGIKGKLWRILRKIYKHVESCVLLGKNRTDWFETEVGLRQGCLLSPILFLIFLNDLVEEINKLGKGVKCGSKRVSILLFADDIVLIADSKEDLELLLQVVYEFSLKWRFKFNLDKSAVLIFNNKRTKNLVYGKCTKICVCNNHWKFGDGLIQQVLIYKYLGTDLDNCLSFKVFKERLLHKARTNMARIYAMGIKNGHLSVSGSINLYQALVRSILEYSCEVWSKDLWSDAEDIQYEMGRRILKCSSKTSKVTILGELGLWRLKARRDLKKILYYFHLISLPEDRILKQAFRMSKNNPSNKSNFCSIIYKLLNKYQLLHVWKNESKIFNLDNRNNNESKNMNDHKRFWKNYLWKVINKVEEKEWIERLRKLPKLRTYRYFKQNLRLENYLSSSNLKGRMLMTAIRTGTNKLLIERGRWCKKTVLDRVCNNCNLNQVENEVHFLILCPKYEDLRKKLYEKIAQISNQKWILENYSVRHRFLLLINGTGDNFQHQNFGACQSFLVKAFKLRKE